jgi:hypothetical protein
LPDPTESLEHPLADERQAAPPSNRRTQGYVRSFAPARVCGTLGCTTVLSCYNEATLCWLHGSPIGRLPTRS